MTGHDYIVAGDFARAIEFYRTELEGDPEDTSRMARLATAYSGAGDFRSALPLLEKVNESKKRKVPDTCGQILDIAIAHWCLDDWERALGEAGNLCDDLLAGRVNMVPDSAAGATFGLILHYMAVTAGDTLRLEQAMSFLRNRNALYDKKPTAYDYPLQSVKQILGELGFEDALEGATGAQSVKEAWKAAQHSRVAMGRLGPALFCDGVLKRRSGDDAGCRARMTSVVDLGHRTNHFYWYLARDEMR